MNSMKRGLTREIKVGWALQGESGGFWFTSIERSDRPITKRKSK